MVIINEVKPITSPFPQDDLISCADSSDIAEEVIVFNSFAAQAWANFKSSTRSHCKAALRMDETQNTNMPLTSDQIVKAFEQQQSTMEERRRERVEELKDVHMRQLHDRALAAQYHMRFHSFDKPAIWSGNLPARVYQPGTFSTKVFIGGVRYDMTQAYLESVFSQYGSCTIDFPRWPKNTRVPFSRSSGYVYVIFQDEGSVAKLLRSCIPKRTPSVEWYLNLDSSDPHNRAIRHTQIIPWSLSDSTFVRDIHVEIDLKLTVFVGAVHGMLTASVLYLIMSEAFGEVDFVGIDTDKYKYPIGSARVTFSNQKAFFAAVGAGFLDIRTAKFSKRLQIDPYLEDTLCMTCGQFSAQLFCRDPVCFRYFCNQCWEIQHKTDNLLLKHKPLMRSASRFPVMVRSFGMCLWLHDRSAFNGGSAAQSLPSGRAIMGVQPFLNPMTFFNAVASMSGSQYSASSSSRTKSSFSSELSPSFEWTLSPSASSTSSNSASSVLMSPKVPAGFR